MTEYGFLLAPVTAASSPTASRDALLSVARHCEDVGLSTVLIAEHHQSPHYFSAPLIVASAVAAHTERIRVGSGISLLPLRHPVRVFEEAVTLADLSADRFVLGVGAGYDSADFRCFGLDVSERVARFDEALDVLSKLFRAPPGTKVTHRGDAYACEFTTPAESSRRPPLWVGAWSRKGLRRAAHYGDCWLADPGKTVPELVQAAEDYRLECDGSSAQIAVLRDLCILGDEARNEVMLRALAQTMGHYESRGAIGEGLESSTDADPRSDRSILGAVQECAAQVKRVRTAVHPSHIIFRLPGTTPWPARMVHDILDDLGDLIALAEDRDVVGSR